MMGRRVRQVFASPMAEEEELPIPPSPWHTSGIAYLPHEQWELLLRYAARIDPMGSQALANCSYTRNGSLFIRLSDSELKKDISFLEHLMESIGNDRQCLAELAEGLPEILEPEEHIRMLEAVKAVFEQSAQVGKPLKAWLE